MINHTPDTHATQASPPPRRAHRFYSRLALQSALLVALLVALAFALLTEAAPLASAFVSPSAHTGAPAAALPRPYGCGGNSGPC